MDTATIAPYANVSRKIAEDVEDNRKRAVSEGRECPDCGSRSTESNGSTEYRCCKCDHRWGFEGGRGGESYGF